MAWPDFFIAHMYRYCSETFLYLVGTAFRCGCVLVPLELPTIGSISTRNGASVAQKVQTLFVDDIDGSAAEGTIRFGLAGIRQSRRDSV
jgi:hypothetical protein